MKTYKLIIPSAKTYLKRIVLIYGAQVRAGAHKHTAPKTPGWPGGAAAPPPSIRRGSSAASRTAIFVKQSLPCESKNRYLTVFAPGNLRRDFSKNCYPIAFSPTV